MRFNVLTDDSCRGRDSWKPKELQNGIIVDFNPAARYKVDCIRDIGNREIKRRDKPE